VFATKVANSKTKPQAAGPKVKIAKSDPKGTDGGAGEAFTEVALAAMIILSVMCRM
jgi:hypothetical protein